MVNAALIGTGWWGKYLDTAVQKKSSELQLVLGVNQPFAIDIPLTISPFSSIEYGYVGKIHIQV